MSMNYDILKVLNEEKASTDKENIDEMFQGPVIRKKRILKGKVVMWRTHKTHRHRPLSMARRRALKKAHIANMRPKAIALRKKSLRRRSSFEEEVNYIPVNTICPACGGQIVMDDYGFYCVDCGEVLRLEPTGIEVEPSENGSDDEVDLRDYSSFGYDPTEDSYYDDTPEDDQAADKAEEVVNGEDTDYYNYVQDLADTDREYDASSSEEGGFKQERNKPVYRNNQDSNVFIDRHGNAIKSGNNNDDVEDRLVLKAIYR